MSKRLPSQQQKQIHAPTTAAQRTFVGQVTDNGVINDGDAIFSTSAIRGCRPQIGDRVVVQANGRNAYRVVKLANNRQEPLIVPPQPLTHRQQQPHVPWHQQPPQQQDPQQQQQQQVGTNHGGGRAVFAQQQLQQQQQPTPNSKQLTDCKWAEEEPSEFSIGFSGHPQQKQSMMASPPVPTNWPQSSTVRSNAQHPASPGDRSPTIVCAGAPPPKQGRNYSAIVIDDDSGDMAPPQTYFPGGRGNRNLPYVRKKPAAKSSRNGQSQQHLKQQRSGSASYSANVNGDAIVHSSAVGNANQMNDLRQLHPTTSSASSSAAPSASAATADPNSNTTIAWMNKEQANLAQRMKKWSAGAKFCDEVQAHSNGMLASMRQ